jgi:tetratricopeptide (TPR) repeat protein
VKQLRLKYVSNVWAVQRRPIVLKTVTLLLALIFTTLVNTKTISFPNPWLATVITFATVFILPGFLLSGLVFSKEDLSWPARLPAAFALGVGMLSLPAVIFLVSHANLEILGWVSAAINIILGGLYIWVTGGRVADGTRATVSLADSLNPFLFTLTLLAVSGVLYLYLITASTWSFGDVWSYLFHIRRYLDHSLTAIITTFPNGDAPGRAAFSSWVILQALMDRVATVEPLDVYSFYFPPILLIVSLLAFYSLAHALFHNRNASLLALLLQVLYYLSSIGSHEWVGRGFFDRIIEDKFLVLLILLPITVLLMLKYLESGKRKHFLPLALSTLALGLTHPIGLAQWGISLASFAFLHLLFNLKRDKILRFVIIFASLLLFLLVPFVQRQIMVGAGTAFGYAEGSEIQFSLSQTRLWMFSAVKNQYMAHPHLVAHPLTLLAIVLTPLLIPYLRHSMAAQFLFSNMAVPLLLLYNPISAPLLGRLITPWMLWRVSWLLPVSLTLGFFLDKIIRWIQGSLTEVSLCVGRPHVLQMVPVLIVVLMAIPLQGYIADGLGSLKERKERTLSQYERDLLLHLPEQVAPGSVIIADPALNDYIPAFVGDVRLLTFRWNGLPSATEDIERLYGARLVDRSVLDALHRWNARYLVIKRGHPLALQFDLLPFQFTRLYHNDGYAVYQVSPAAESSHVIVGNTYFLAGEWDKAIAEYEQTLAFNPDDTLAHMGLGQVYQAQARKAEAQAEYERAISARPDNVMARLALAELYATEGKLAEAVDVAQKAITLPPNYPASFEVLGDLYRMRGEGDLAFEQYAKAIEFPPNTGDYHLALGDLYWAKGLPERAIAEYKAAVTLAPHFWKVYMGHWNGYLRLAQAYQAQGKLEDAIAVYQRAINSEPNFELAYTRLGDIYLAQGLTKQAIALYQDASRRNLNSAWPHIELGKLYLQQGMASSGNETN